MTVDGWVTVALSLATGFAIWMFRIDRICTRLESKLDEVAEWRKAMTGQIAQHSAKLDEHGTRIARLEAIGAQR